MSIKTKAGLRKVYKKVSPKDRDCDQSNMGKGNADAREEIARRENLRLQRIEDRLSDSTATETKTCRQREHYNDPRSLEPQGGRRILDNGYWILDIG